MPSEKPSLRLKAWAWIITWRLLPSSQKRGDLVQIFSVIHHLNYSRHLVYTIHSVFRCASAAEDH